MTYLGGEKTILSLDNLQLRRGQSQPAHVELQILENLILETKSSLRICVEIRRLLITLFFRVAMAPLLEHLWTLQEFRAAMIRLSELTQSVSRLITNCTILGESSRKSSLSSNSSACTSMVWRQVNASFSNSS